MDLYTYKATCTRVIDGDTIVCNIDMGFYTQLNEQTIRLARINAPELPTVEGYRSKIRLQNLIEGKEIVIKTEKIKRGTNGFNIFSGKDKFGRWLGEIFYNSENISDLLVKENLATNY
ncbi:MAG TPA: thermonuclease family protein [Spirochaetota bacterium]|nr:thermonuclease family protein [Spirochaetota bacterium]